MRVFFLALISASVSGTQIPATAIAADRLVLRNLDIVADCTVISFDEDGVQLDGSRSGGDQRVTWDQIERGKIAIDQSRFDALLAELGPPLYRIRQRLKIGDYEALAEPAEALYLRFAQRKSQTAYMVCQAVMWSRLATGRREAAVEPLLRSFELLRSGAAHQDSLPGSRRLVIDRATALSPELLPVWFDHQAARAALPPLQEAIRSMSQPRPVGAIVYYASLALAAGDAAEAERVMRSIDEGDPNLRVWSDVLHAQQEVMAQSPGEAVERWRTAAARLPAAFRPIALYWVGLADTQKADEATCRDGILALLTLPAAHGGQQPELAAAGLYRAAEALDKLKDERGAAAVRKELIGEYGNTYFGVYLRAGTNH